MKSLMTKSLVVAVVAAFSIPLTVSAQDGQNEQGGLVAVLDVAKVFKANTDFEQRMQKIKAEADTLKAQIQQQQETIRSRAQQVGQYELGSPERNKLEGEIEQEQTSLRTRARQAETDLLNREAQIYYETYQQVQSTVANIASQYGISLVLRFDSEPINQTNRGEVIKGVNRSVVYHHKLDLTNMVIRALNPQAAEGANATQRK